VEMDMPYVRAEAIKQVVNVLRMFPSAKDYILPALARCLKRVEDNDARAALIWIVGEYGDEVTEAPYMLEPIIDNYDEENSVAVKLQMLSSAMKLFFKRPPEMQGMLGRLLRQAMNDVNNQDVHDRALLYYRLLSADINVAASLFAGLNHQGMMGNGGFKTYAELREEEKNSQIFNELNTLAVIFGKQSYKFTAEDYQLKSTPATIPDYSAAEQALLPPAATPSSSSSPSVPSVAAPSVASHAPAATTNAPSYSNSSLIDFGDDFSAVLAAPAVTQQFARPTPSLLLDASVELSPQKFQQLWLSLPDSVNGRVFGVTQVPNATQQIEQSLRQNKIITMASGPLPSGTPPGLKFFLYAGEVGDLLSNTDGALFLAQIIISPGDVTANIKTTSNQPQSIKDFLDILKTSLASLGLQA